MDTLYPENYEAPKQEELKKDPELVKKFIMELAKEPITRSDIIAAVDAKYCETKDEAYHLLGNEIGAIVDEIDAEWHPKKDESITPVTE